jgi:hypothetical protein
MFSFGIEPGYKTFLNKLWTQINVVLATYGHVCGSSLNKDRWNVSQY